MKSFTVMAVDDAVDDDDESVELGFGTLPTGVSAGSTPSATVSLADNDLPLLTVSFTEVSYGAREGDSVAVAVELSADPERAVTIVIAQAVQGGATAQGATGEDYSGVPGSLAFGASETVKSFTVMAVDDAVDDDDESVLLSFGSPLPTGISGGSTPTAMVVLTDDDDPAVEVSFEEAAYTVDEGASVVVTVDLSADPERELTITITNTNLGTTSSSDYMVPPSVTFTTGQTSESFTVMATDDTEDDDGESVVLGFGPPPGVSASGTAGTTTVSITDDDFPGVEVSFGETAYTVDEGASVVVAVELSADPERAVTIAITTMPQGTTSPSDYMAPANVTFTSGQTSGSFTVMAVDDAVDDDGESVLLSFGSPLPTGISGGSTPTATVVLTDDDDPAVEVSFEEAAYTVDEGASVVVTVELSADPERELTITITNTNLGTTSSSDYMVPPSVTFTTGQTSESFTVMATDDTEDDDGESVVLGFGPPAGVSASGTGGTTTVSITDDDFPGVEVSFGETAYTVDEGASVAVAVELSADPERAVTIVITTMPQGTTSPSDYMAPANVTFTSGQTSGSFTVMAVDDAVDDDGESVLLSFGSPLPTGISGGSTPTATVVLTDDDDPEVEVSFEEAAYTVDEGASVVVTVELSADPERELTITITNTNLGTTSSSDYMVPPSVTFTTGQTSESFTVMATDDTEDDDGESVVLGFGPPAGVSASGTAGTTTVSITDDDDPAVEVSFGEAAYTVAEGSEVPVTVELSADPERTLTIQVMATVQGTATAGDYTAASSVTFTSGQTSRTLTVSAANDSDDDDDEGVKFTFGTLPPGVTAGSQSEATVSITDTDDPAVVVEFGQALYAVAEGGEQAVTVTLSAVPEREVTITITQTQQNEATAPGETGADYSGVPASLVFGATETEKTFTVSVTDDDIDDDDESVELGFGTLPTGVSAGSTASATVNLTDDDLPLLTVSFTKVSYGAGEGDSVAVTVELSADPERAVTIVITQAAQGGATAQGETGADYSGVPGSLVFGASEVMKSFTVMAVDDAVDDDDESVLLSFGSPLPTGISGGRTTTATMMLTDDDDPEVEVSFGEAAYTVAEGSEVPVTVELSADPERTLTIQVMATVQGTATAGDYTAASSVTFTSGQTSRTLTVSAANDSDDDDGESVTLSFGTLPPGVTAGSQPEATVSITDTDDPAVVVEFGQALYAVAEGGEQAVTVTLSAVPEREVTITITQTQQNEATAPGETGADYSGVPASLVFGATETEKTFTVSVTDDDIDDDDESVELGFGTLPTGVSAGSTASATVNLTDDDLPLLTVSFTKVSYGAGEGDSVAVTVELSADPERAVTIVITQAAQGGATAQGESGADYSGVPGSLVFGASEVMKSFTVMAVDDAVDDDDESVLLSFGSPLPTGISGGRTTTVSITDDDDPAVEVSFGEAAYTVAEGSEVPVTVELSADPERTLTIQVMATVQGTATAGDYTAASSVTFTSGQTSRTLTVSAANDSDDDDGESVTFTFGTLPPGVTAGSQSEATVSITDTDDPAVVVEFGQALYAVAEGGEQAVTVTLSAVPEREVTITITQTQQNEATAQGETGADYSGVPASLVFGATETEKTFTVSVTDDDIDDDDESVELGFGTLPTGVSASGTAGTTTVSITDDDDPAVEVSFGEAAYTVAEGSEVPVTVELSADPERTLTIQVMATVQGAATAGDYTAASSVTFTSGQTSRSFTLTATDDDIDDDGESVELSFGRLPDRVTEGSPSETTVSLSDDDERELVLSGTSVDVDEGATATYTLALASEPTANVTVTLSVTGDDALTTLPAVSPLSLTFTPSDWDAAQPVTVTAPVDADAEKEDATIAHAVASDGDYGASEDETLGVEVTDDGVESAMVTLSTDRAMVEEDAGATVVTVTATLDAGAFKEAKTVTVMLSRGADTEAEDYAAPPSLTLTLAAQMTVAEATFTLTPTDDALWEPEPEGLALSGSVVGLTVTGTSLGLTDDDDEPVLSFTGPSEMAETGGSVELVVAISNGVGFEAAQTVDLVFTGGTATQGTDYTDDASSDQLMLDAGVVSASATVTLMATADGVDEDDGLADASDDERILVQASHGPLTRGTEVLDTTLTVAILDDDDPEVAVTLDPLTRSVSEAGASSAMVVVEIDADPEREVVVVLEQTLQGGASASDYTTDAPGTVTFTASDHGPVTITVTATDDAIDDDGEAVALSLEAPVGDARVSVGGPSTVTIVDDDTRGVTALPDRLDLNEGESGTYEVTLGSAPTGTVTVTVESGHASVAVSPGTLTFTATDTGPKAVTVEAVQDADAANVSASVTHAVSGADYGANNVTGPTVSVVVDDDEVSSSQVTLELDPERVSEGAGATEVTVTARLDGSALLQAMTVTATLAAGTAQASDYALDRSRLSLTIAPGELAGSATVMLTPADDEVDEDDEMVSVTGTASNGLTVVSTVLTIVDDDTRGVTVTPTALAVDEGMSGQYTVALDSTPTGAVTVTVSAAGGAAASVRVFPAALVFTGSDHGAKTVTVSARGDRDEDDGTVTVAHAVTGADYAAETAASVTVAVTDTGIVRWDVELSVDDESPLAEGGGARVLTATATLLTGVRMQAVAVSVTVSGKSADAADFRASPGSFTLTIPAGSEEASRQLTLTPVDDGVDEADETLVVAPSVPSGLSTNEDGVELTIVDDDTRGVTVAPTALTLAEGAQGSYTVSLGSQPSGSVTVSVTLSGSDSVTANRSSLVFTGSNWGSAQAVRVTAEQDADPNDESVTVTHAVTGGDYDGEPAASVQVTVTDDDKPSEAVRLSLTPDTVAEGAGATTLTVTGMLDASAREDAMEVTLSIPIGEGYTAVGATLTIAAGAVSGTARLTLTPVDDAADLADLPVTVEATTSAQATLAGGTTQPMRLEPGTLTVTIEDDDERGVTVTPTALTVAEGGSGEYTMVLRSEPDGGAVEVTLSLSDDDANAATDASVMPASLTFQPAAWNRAQTVTVTVSEDDEVEADATATIAHAVLGADYGTETVSSVTVTVPGYEMMEDGGVQVLVSPSGSVTVPSGMPALAGLSLALPVANGGKTVTVRTISMPDDEPRGFSLGDMVVDISGVELRSGETATVCLPATEGSEMSIQRWDETTMAWMELDEPPGGSPSGQVCGVTDHFSMFAVMARLEEPELVLSAEALTVTVGEDEGATYTVALGLQPAGAVTVTVTGHEGTELSVTPVMLVFTAADWNVPQAVTARVSEEAEPGEAALVHEASGGRYLESWEATLAVTVGRDTGLLQRAREAWLARFGRTAAGHVAEAVAQRLSVPAGQETRLTLGGTQPQEALVAGVLRTLAGESKPDGRRMLADSAFVLPLSSDGEQGWTAWGRGAYTEFDNEEDGLKLDGEVSSGTLGVDVEWGGWRLGLALSHSEGEGDIREADGERYELESSLTGAYPYARWQLDETVSVWGVLGYGEGELEQERDGERTETDLEMRMAAFGARGALGGVENGLGTFELSLKSDLLAVRVEADADADLPEVEADAQRVRLLLEGAGHRELESGGVLAPTLEAGLRYDEGDAETGLGAELGAGLRYADGSGRLSAELSARALLAHEQSGYEEWGVGGSLRLEPDASGRGLSLHLESARGATGSGTEELWTRRDLSGLAPADDFEAAGRFRAEMGLGLNAPGGLGTLTPYVGYERTDRESAWHLGGRLKAGADLEIEIEGTMRRGDGASDWQELNLYLSGRW